MKNKMFGIAVLAMLREGRSITPQLWVFVRESSSRKEALGIGYVAAINEYPPRKGYENHIIVATEVPRVENKMFAIAVLVMLKEGRSITPQLWVFVKGASSREEALGIGYVAAMEEYPPRKGYENHIIVATEVPRD